MNTRELRPRLCEALLTGWDRDKNMAYVLTGLVKDCDQGEIDACCVVLRVAHILFKKPVRAFIAENYPNVSDALWARRPTDVCADLLRRTLRGRVREGRMAVGARANDKRHDWKTVK